MNVGSLRHLVTIRAPAGVIAEAPVDLQTSVPMAIEVWPPEAQQREFLALGGLQTQTIYTLTCRYRTDILPAYVLVEQCCTQRTFQIVATIPSDRHDGLAMTCLTAG